MNFKQWLILSETITVKDQEFRDPLYALKHIQKTHPNPENLVVTFTAIDKVGINPKSTYDTPFGIYFYPLDYVIHKEMNVEFAGDQPYINVCEFTRPDKILHMTDDVNNQKGLELLNVFPQEEVDLAIENLENNYELRSNYSKLWLVTREMAKKRAITTSDSLDVYYGAEEKTNNPILWNANLRKCGIDGFLDHNTKTIHRNEPTQGVVFTANSLKRILVIPQKLFSKQGNPMPVRKPLPSLDKIPLNQLENLLKTRNLSDNGFLYLLHNAPNKDEMARLIVQHAKELSDNIINNLFDVAFDKQEMARFIAQRAKELSGDRVSALLAYAADKDQMARILGLDNINKLNGGHVKNLINHAPDKEEMAEILGPNNINKLSDDNVYGLLSNASNKDKMINLIIKYKTELSSYNVSDLLAHASDQDQMAEILGPDNINKLTINNVYNLLKYSPDKEKIAKILGPDNINKLDNENVSDLLGYTPYKEKMAEILGPDKLSKLNANQVSNLIYYTSDKDKMANILGSENINKIIDDGNPAYIDWLFGDQEPIKGKEEMRQILRKYYTGKDQELISILNQ